MSDEMQPVERKRGRPRSAVPHSRVMTWLPVEVHDRLIRIANARETSVSGLVNRIVVLTLQKPSAD